MRLTIGGLSDSTVNIPFSASNFNATGGGTWTLIAANQTTFQYIQVGSLIHLDFFANAGTIAGNPPKLLLTIPFTVTNTSTCFAIIDPLGNPAGAMGVLAAGSNQVALQPLTGNWGNGVTPLSFEITFSI